ncbi:hypothetical protein EZS27_019938, partial [termite gut metagenome]
MTKLLPLLLVFSLLFVSSCKVEDKQENSQWRGQNRDGVYNEKGLLKQWPEAGPELLWSFEGLGEGHTS